MLTRIILTVLVLSFLVNGSSQSVEETPAPDYSEDTNLIGVEISMDNDFFNPLLNIHNDDTEYTGGFQVNIHSKKPIFPLLYIPLKNTPCKNISNSLYLFGQAYTPNRTQFIEAHPVHDARPYASFIGIGKNRMIRFGSSRFMLESDFNIGSLGLNIMGRLQNWLHTKVTNKPEVKGWKNQIENGGKIGFNLKHAIHFLMLDHKDYYLDINPFINFGNIKRTEGIKLSMGRTSLHPLHSPEKKSINFSFRTDFILTHISHNSLLSGLKGRQQLNSHWLAKSQISKFVPEAKFRIGIDHITLGNKTPTLNTYLQFNWIGKEHQFRTHHVYGTVGIKILNI